METQSLPIERLRLSDLLRKQGYKRPTRAQIALFEDIGPMQPAIVERAADGVYEILCQERIWFVAQELQVPKIPVLAVEPSDDKQRLEIVRGSRDEDPITKAERYEKWLQSEPGRNKSKLAALEGCTRSNISHQVRLLSLDPTVREWVRSRRLSLTHGKVLLQVEQPERQVKLALTAIKSGWSISALKAAAAARGAAEASKSSAGPTKDPDTLRLERDLSEVVGSTVEIDGRDGCLVIDYRNNLDVLDGIIERLRR